jgi:hypothetical protein
VLSGSKGSSPGHSANQTKPLSALDAGVLSLAEPYQPIDIEKQNLQEQKRASVTASSRQNPKRLTWNIMRQQSIEVTRNTLPPAVSGGPVRNGSWSKPAGLSSTTTTTNTSPKSKRLSKVFTRWWGTTNSSNTGTGTGSISTDNATLQNPLSPQLQQHPLRHEPPPAIHNFSKPMQRPSTASQIPETNLVWPLREPNGEAAAADSRPRRTLSDRVPKRTLSDGAYHRVEIRRNPFIGRSEVTETPEENGAASDDRDTPNAQSRATTMTTHFS